MAASIVSVVALGAGVVTVAAQPASALTPTCGSTSSPLDPTIVDNVATPTAGSLRAAADGTFGPCSTVVLQAGATYVLSSHPGCGELEIDNSMTIESSSTGQNATIQQTCTSSFGSRVAEIDSGSFTVTLDNLNLTGGQQNDNGGALKTVSNADTLILNADQLTGNRSDEDGGAINSHGTLQITNSTIAGNCAADGGGAVLLNSPGGPTLIQNSTISGNNQGLAAGAIEDVSGALTMNYVTLVANTSSDTPGCGSFVDSAAQTQPSEPNDAVPHPGVGAQAPAPPVANLSVSNDDGGQASLTSFGTVIGDIAATSFNCSLGGDTPTSAGYNYENGGAGVPPGSSCGLHAATDVQNGVDPNLGALGANGGPTNTQVPQTSSTLINAIPDPGGGCPESPTTITTDQRGVTRPQGPGCEIGAVEVLVVLPTAAFTG